MRTQGASGSGRSTQLAGGTLTRTLLVAGIVVVGVAIAAGAIALVRESRAASSPQPVAALPAPPETPPVATALSAAPGPAAAETTASAASAAPAREREPAPVTEVRDNPAFAAPVGASPLSVRASTAIDLYDPATQPVFDITKRTELPPVSSEEAYVQWMLAHTDQQEKYLQGRWERAAATESAGLLVHSRVLLAFLMTPREWFVRSFNLAKTYANTAIPIGYGQTISGPELVAHMTDELDPQPNQRVLEIGTGSGYQSAFLSELSNFVYTIEIVRPLAEETNQIYLSHTKENPEYANIHRRLADGYYGWPAYAPFDRIIVTTGIDHIPPELLKELAPNGIMLIPIGPPSGQVVLKITKTVDAEGNVHLTREDIYHGFKREIFVPFTASGGGTHNLGESN